MPQVKMSRSWSHGIAECAEDPGGCSLCWRTMLCPCLVLGEIHQQADGHCGFLGGAVGCLCLPYMLAIDAPLLASSAGFEESSLKAFLCSCSPCGPCYIIQLRKECYKLAAQKEQQKNLTQLRTECYKVAAQNKQQTKSSSTSPAQILMM